MTTWTEPLVSYSALDVIGAAVQSEERISLTQDKETALSIIPTLDNIVGVTIYTQTTISSYAQTDATKLASFSIPIVEYSIANIGLATTSYKFNLDYTAVTSTISSKHIIYNYSPSPVVVSSTQACKGTSTVTTSTSITYYLRAWNSNGNKFVYWNSVGTPNVSPTITSPTYTGTLANICIIGVVKT